MKKGITAFQNTAQIKISKSSVQSMPWADALELVARYQKFQRIAKLPAAQRSVAYAAIGLYAITGGKI